MTQNRNEDYEDRNEDSEKLPFITPLARKKAEKKVEKVFDKSGIGLWLKAYRGGTYCNVETQLKICAERMFAYEYTVDELSKFLKKLYYQNSRLGEEAGKLKASLKLWEINDVWKFSRITPKNNYHRFLQVISQLYVPFTKIIHGLVELLLKTFLSFIIIISLIFILNQVFQGEDLSKLQQVVLPWSYLSGIAIVHLLSTSIYNWYTSSIHQNIKRQQDVPVSNPTNSSSQNIESQQDVPVSNSDGWSKLAMWIRSLQPILPDKFAWLLLLIWLIEGLLGYEILSKALDKASKPLQLIDHLFITLSVSIFALVNIFFSVSLAKRDCHLLNTKEKLLELLEKRRDITQLIETVEKQIKEAAKWFETYKDEYTTLLGEEGGILAHIANLSRYAYPDSEQPGKIPLSQDEKNMLDLMQRHPQDTEENNTENQQEE